MSKRLKEVDYEFWGTHITPPYPTCHTAIKPLHATNRAVQKNEKMPSLQPMQMEEKPIYSPQNIC